MAAPVQLKTGSNTASDSLAVTLDSNVTAGNTIVVAIWGYTSGGFDNNPSVTDGLGNTYTRWDYWGVTGNNKTFLFRAYNVTGGACTVTINPTGSSSDIKAVVFELIAIAGNGDPNDVQDGADTTASGTTHSTPSVTPATTEWCAIAIVSQHGTTSSISPEAGWIQDLSVLNDSTDTAGSIVHKSGTSTSSLSHTWTMGTSTDTGPVQIGVFKTGAAGGASSSGKLVGGGLVQAAGLVGGKLVG